MNRLLLAETKRFWARRISRYFPLALAVLVFGGIVIAFFVIRNNDSNFDFVRDIARSEGPNEPVTVLGPIASLLPVMAFVLGASYIGADLKSGVIEQLLTWEPRRIRLLAARIIGGGVSTAILAALLSVWMVALLYGLASVVGTTGGTDADLWIDTLVAIARTGLASLMFFAIGVAVTLLVNSSVGAIVGFVIYWFIGENFLISAFLPQVAVWLPITNATSFGGGQDVEYIDGSVFSDDFELISHHSYQTAGLYLTLWTLLFVVAAAFWFSYRDVD